MDKLLQDQVGRKTQTRPRVRPAQYPEPMTSPPLKSASDLHSSNVDGIPVLWSTPESEVAIGRLALWLPFLGGTKETVAPFLRRLSDAGYLAVSLDPWQHGERSTEAPLPCR